MQENPMRGELDLYGTGNRKGERQRSRESEHEKERSEIAESEHIPRTGETDPFPFRVHRQKPWKESDRVEPWKDSLAVQKKRGHADVGGVVWAKATWTISIGNGQGLIPAPHP